MSAFVRQLQSRYHARAGLLYRLLRPAVSARNALRRLVPACRAQVWFCRGLERHSGLELAYFYSGNNEQRAYLKRLAFQGDVLERRLGPRWRWLVRRALYARSKDGVGFEFRQLPDMTPGARAAKGGLILPEWIWGTFVFADIHPSSHAIHEHRRRIRKWGFGYAVTSEPEAVRRFIREMVMPYSRRHFGAELLGWPAEECPWGDDRAEVLLVTHEGVEVAGSLIVYGADGPVLWRVGVLDGDPELVRKGALQAAYYFQHEHLRRLGFSGAQAGGTKPFFSDGVLTYKRTWGLRLTGPWRHVFLLRVRRTSEAVRSFLVNNPFVMWEEGKLAAAVFLARDTPPPEEDLEPLTRFLWPGIEYVAAFYFGRTGREDPAAPPVSGIPGVVVRKVPL